MPLFFVITGYVFNTKRDDTVLFFKNLVFKLIVPWLALTVPIYIVNSVIKGSFSYLLSSLKDVLSGQHTWYMPCIIYTEIIWFFTIKLTNRFNGKGVYIISLLICAAGILFGKLHILEFGMINRAMIAQFFLLIGYTYKIREKTIIGIEAKFVVLMVAAYLLLALTASFIWPGQVIDVHMNRYYNYFFCFFLIVLGCTATFLVSEKYLRWPSTLVFIGQNTIVFYLLHMWNVQIFVHLISFLHISLPDSFYLTAVIKTVASIIGCGVEAMIINRYFPWLVGRRATTAKKEDKRSVAG